MTGGRHYLDHASTSRIRPEVVEAMVPWLGAADAGRVHTEGRMARAAIEDARDRVAALAGARSREVVFTSGMVEAINAATFGAAHRWADTAGRDPRQAVVVTTAVEHSAVLDSAARHQRVVVPVDRRGRAAAAEVAAVLDAHPGAALLHVQWGNHEVGTLQPVLEAVTAARERGVLVHVDAHQAAGRVPIDFAGLGADLLSFGGHEFGGPKGVGVLLVRRGLRLPPLLVGGEQERARRAGVEDVAAIVGLGAASEAAATGVDEEAAAARRHTTGALQAAMAVGGVVAYGDTDSRLPHIVCMGVDGVEAEAVLLGLDQAGVAAHSGSSCSSESLEPSPVLEAMGVEAERSLRISTGWSTTAADIEAFASAFPAVVDRLRRLATGS